MNIKSTKKLLISLIVVMGIMMWGTISQADTGTSTVVKKISDVFKIEKNIEDVVINKIIYRRDGKETVIEELGTEDNKTHEFEYIKITEKGQSDECIYMHTKSIMVEIVGGAGKTIEIEVEYFKADLNDMIGFGDDYATENYQIKIEQADNTEGTGVDYQTINQAGVLKTIMLNRRSNDAAGLKGVNGPYTHINTTIWSSENMQGDNKYSKVNGNTIIEKGDFGNDINYRINTELNQRN